MRKILFLFLLLALCGALIACGEQPQPTPPSPNGQHTTVWDAGTVVHPATCQETGLMCYTCLYCDETRTEVIPLSGHAFGEGDMITQATCGKNGILVRFCAVCEEMERTVISATGIHDWDDGAMISVPTATSEGSMLYQCNGCATTKVAPPDPIKHATLIREWREKLEALALNEYYEIGETFGQMRGVSVEDCGEVTNALELDCTESGSNGAFGIAIPTGQFDLQSGKVYVMSFYSKLGQTFDTMRVSVRGTASEELTGFTYQLAGQWTKICVPFTATGKEAEIRMTTGGAVQKMYLAGISVEESNTTFEAAKSGYFMVASDEWEYTEIDAKETANKLGVGSCMDVVAVGNYIYAIAGSRLCVFKPNGVGENPTKIYESQKYGDLRQMSVTDDGKGIVVTARSNGAFVFDISQPEQPKLASRIDSLEAASGLDIQGKYCYIADRIFGIDIIDISDLYKPVVISNIKTGESQDCKVYNGYLYVGVWGSCKIVVCDVRDPAAPKIVNNVYMKGRGDGINIKNGILYAATGHMETNVPQSTSPGYALGNGMEIFDVSADPVNPRLLSRVRAEGRMYCSSPDIWRVKIAGNYAYLSSTYNGLYVYDVTNKNLPKRVAHIEVVSRPGASTPPRSTWVYPYDPMKESHCALIDCAVLNGSLYIASTYADLYVLHGKSYVASSFDTNDSTVFPEQNYTPTYYDNDFSAIGIEGAKLFKPGSQIWSVAEYGAYLYVAAGTDGIYVLDRDMKVVKNYPAKDITNDVRIHGNYLYSAENTAGLVIYEINADDPTILTQKGQYRESSGATFAEVALSPDGRYALVQRANNSLLLNVSDKTAPKLHKSFGYGMVYQNQLARDCIANRYLIVFANGNKTVVCDFGENGSYDVPVINESWTSGMSQTNGVTADGSFAFANMGGTVYVFDPSDDRIYTTTLGASTVVRKYTVSGLSGGIPYVIDGYAFVASRANGTLTILKLSDDRSTAPTVVKKYSFNGHPARICKIGTKIYIPLGYGGLLEADLSDLID